MPKKPKKVTNEHIFVSPHGVVYSQKKTTTPVGELAFPHLSETTENYNKDGHEYSMTLQWDNEDVLKGQKIYEKFMAEMEEFISHACEHVPREELRLPIVERDLYKDEPERGTRLEMRLRLDAKGKAKPKLYDHETKALIPEDELPKKLQMGDKAYVRGCFYYTASLIEQELVHLVKVRLDNVMHYEDGVKLEKDDGVPEWLSDTYFEPGPSPKPAKRAVKKKEQAASGEEEDF